jgi:thiamine biosynthesis lipoprotein
MMPAHSRPLATTALPLLALLALGACSREADREDRPTIVEPAPTPAPAPPRPEAELHTVERLLMGTGWRVSIWGDDAAAARRDGELALEEVARLEQILSEWRPTSDISRLNAAAGTEPIVVDPALFDCVRASLDVARWSGGAYDVSWAVMRDVWRFGDNGRDVPPTAAEVQARLPLWNWERIRVNDEQRSVLLEQRGMQIGLGGVAKGYALDRAHDLLVRAGHENFMLFAGGQVLVRGLRGGRKWRVGIQHPREPRYFAFVEVTNASVATSGDYEHSFMYEGRRYHHILDPETGFPSERSTSVTVIAPTGLWADAVDTAVFILGPERGLPLLEHAPGGRAEAIAVDTEMRVWATPGGAEALILRAELDAAWHIGPEAPRDGVDARLSELPAPVR